MFYERYLELCRKNNISPSAAAIKAGVNKATVSSWKRKYEENVEIDPNKDTVEKICVFFGCDESWLRGINQETKESPASEDTGVNDEVEKTRAELFTRLKSMHDPSELQSMLEHARFIEFKRNEGGK